jgi:hypothetical protein
VTGIALAAKFPVSRGAVDSVLYEMQAVICALSTVEGMHIIK